MDKLLNAGFDVDKGVALVEDATFYYSLVNKFIDELVVKLYQIEDAVAGGEYDEARIMFHSLKGSSAAICHEEIRQRSLELEKCIKEGNLVDIEKKTEQYVSYCSEIIGLVKC